MKNKNYFDIPQPAPICAGTGLIALDVVINGDEKIAPKFWAGGSCGNVLAILSYLGWEAYPIARLGKDKAANEIRTDLAQYKVKLDFVESEENANTPIIVQKNSIGLDGKPTHKFQFLCPNCGARLPRYKAILIKKAQQLSDKLPKITTFYFDKVSPAAIELANAVRARGGLVVFEPSSIGNKPLFKKALQTCHLLKYAHDRLGQIEDLTKEVSPLLQVETLGAKGLRYRRKEGNSQLKPWQMMPAFKINGFRDAAGCGDWCTAGIIHLLGREGSAKLENASEDEIKEALEFSQALAALNCHFEGARGGMYALEKQSLNAAVEKIMLGNQTGDIISNTASDQSSNILQYVCPSCAKPWDRTRTDSKKTVKI